MTKEELTKDQLCNILKQTYELIMHEKLYKLAGYNEKVVQLIAITETADLRISYEELLEKIKSSDMPVEFFQLTKFASIV